MRSRLAAGAVALSAVFAALSAGPAHAEGYRYWSFWDRDGQRWAYATQGPSIARPADGEVVGARFSVSADSQDASKPRGPADFDTICAGTPAKDGSKRVALVLDFGTAADAPDGETPPKGRDVCARVTEDASTAEALAVVAKPLRYNSASLLCSISGYPKAGCGEQVSGDGSKTSAPAAHKNDSGDSGGDSGPSVGLIAGIAAVLALGAAGVWQARRRRG